jgi:hypothetical protein
MKVAKTDVIYAIEAPSGRYYQRDGRPVWPVRSAGEREGLERMVATLGCRVEYLSDAAEQKFTGPQLVVGLGIEAYEDAGLYAHLTGRRCELVNDLEQLSQFPEASVVVTSYRFVNEELLDRLYDRPSISTAPGLIFSYADEGLAAQVLARSAALHCRAGNFERRRVDVNPTISFGVQTSSTYSIIGGEASPSEFRDALASGAGLLTLYTHSDGIDAFLRDDLVLCPIDSTYESNQPSPAPSCVLTGICHRCSRPMTEVIGTPVLLAPEIVKAQVLVYCVCWGLYPSQRVHSPAYALSRRLLESFSIAALITSWEINIQRLPLTAGLFHDIARGLTLGESLALHLSAPEARSTHHKLCLIGDPELRLAPEDVADPLANIQRFTKPPAPSQQCMADLTLLRLMVYRCTQTDEESRTHEQVLTTIAEYENMLVAGVSYDPDLAARFRRGLVEYLTSQDTMLSKCWNHYTLTTEVLPDKKPCLICGRRTVARLFSLRVVGAKQRRETFCPSCGSIEDVAVDRQMSFAVEPTGLMRLAGAVPVADWHARVTVERFFTRETFSWEWPAAPTSEPAPSFQVPRPWPRVPFRLSLIMVHGISEFSVFGCLYRGSDGDQSARQDAARLDAAANHGTVS